jgi:hypothetical protein
VHEEVSFSITGSYLFVASLTSWRVRQVAIQTVKRRASLATPSEAAAAAEADVARPRRLTLWLGNLMLSREAGVSFKRPTTGRSSAASKAGMTAAQRGSVGDVSMKGPGAPPTAAPGVTDGGVDVVAVAAAASSGEYSGEEGIVQWAESLSEQMVRPVLPPSSQSNPLVTSPSTLRCTSF